MQATLTSKGQITLPVALRRKLHLKAGDVLKFDENSFRKALTKSEIKRMRSTLGRGKMELKGKSMKDVMECLRGPSDYEW
jgi:AbrB family looped-hinge helix DNA binding protein